MGNEYDRAISWLKELTQQTSKADVISRTDAARATFYKVLDGKNTNARDFVGWLESLGAHITYPEETSVNSVSEVCFVAPGRINTDDGSAPVPEDYIAVPLAAGAVAAGRGLIPHDEIRSWVLVWRNHDSVRFRTNLIGVEIGTGQRSMEPTLHPQDIILVDRDDFKDRFAPPGNMFLVREPDDSVMVKRVSIQPRNDDMMLTFYSDNVEYPPLLYSLNEDYDGDIGRAIIGRVVWAWSDMSRK